MALKLAGAAYLVCLGARALLGRCARGERRMSDAMASANGGGARAC